MDYFAFLDTGQCETVVQCAETEWFVSRSDCRADRRELKFNAVLYVWVWYYPFTTKFGTCLSQAWFHPTHFGVFLSDIPLQHSESNVAISALPSIIFSCSGGALPPPYIDLLQSSHDLLLPACFSKPTPQLSKSLNPPRSDWIYRSGEALVRAGWWRTARLNSLIRLVSLLLNGLAAEIWTASPGLRARRKFLFAKTYGEDLSSRLAPNKSVVNGSDSFSFLEVVDWDKIALSRILWRCSRRFPYIIPIREKNYSIMARYLCAFQQESE